MTYRKLSFSPLSLAAMIFAGVAGPAGAADLYVGEADLPPAPYEDLRYREIYEYPPPRAEVHPYEVRPHEERHYRVRQRYIDHRDACLSRHEIERVLYEDGWDDIEDFEIEGRYVRVEASRVGIDREFDLVLDGCSGRILEARPNRFEPIRRYGYRY